MHNYRLFGWIISREVWGQESGLLTCNHPYTITVPPCFYLNCLALFLLLLLSDEMAFSDSMVNENDGEADKKDTR